MGMDKVDIDNSKIIQASNSYVLGKLVSDTEYLPSIGYEKESITVMKNSSNVVFYVKPVSSEPYYIEENINKYLNSGSIYIAVDSHNYNIFPMGYKMKDESEKIEITRAMFQNKLILFKPHINANGSKIHKNMDIVSIEEVNESHSGYKYTYIPILNINNEEFENKFKSQEPIRLSGKYPDLSYVGYAICGEYIYGYIDGCKKSIRAIDSWIFESENFRKYKIDMNSEEFKKRSAARKKEMVFLERSYLEELDINLTDEGIEIDIKEENNEINSYDNIDNEENDFIHLNISTEIKFLNEFREKTLDHGLYYTKTDLYNFHISVKSNMLTILAGMSGTGKTQIAKCYAETMGLLEENKNLLFLPISPSYTEPEDIIGYLNVSTGLYVPSSTGLVDLLIEAEKNQDKMYAVIFDEMNLAQIEHWFAPFISLLELDTEKRKLSLYSEDCICHNKMKYNSKVKIGDNILFIGTVNLDETTKDLSDRVLDRANVISLKKRSFSELKENYNNINQKTGKQELVKNISFKEYNSWITNKKFINTFNLEELKFFDRLHDLLSSQESMKGISFRVLQGIADYINNIPNDEDELLIGRNEAFDICVKQRILTKIKGSDRELDGLINSDYINEIDIGKLYEFFENEESRKLSEFTDVKLKIKQKFKELRKYGYTN
ncbi:AAA family ATPase [Clostridium botulinum]|uniref:McrB family protein n=1 Tax=Clostridium botulinum TaxID=1491 RepID=UPI001C9B8ED8|nr:AAA family ATPase [Clostridium botulinum]MBY7026290.1 AAA family ATPase [Clostridium botulinum]